MPAPLYLDHLSTTPLDPRVREAMEPWLGARFGHPAARSHAYGWEAEEAVETARARVADLVGADPQEIVFTSGATEADNLALQGAFEAAAGRGRHVVIGAVEHRPVRDTAAFLAARRGAEVTTVPCDARGRVAPEAVAAALRDDTVLVAVQAANAEVGTRQPTAAIGAACAGRAAWFHVDAAHAAAHVALDVRRDGIHLLSLTAHRMGGPKGAGALYVRRRDPRVRLVAVTHGGGHERGMRAGTVNVPAVVGFGVAADLIRAGRDAEGARLAALRDRFEATILARVARVVRHGDLADRLPGVSALAFDGVEAEALLMGMPDIAAASGAGCSSATLEPSYVLAAMGVPERVGHGTVRFSLGRTTTDDDVARAAARVIETVERLRSLGA